MRDPRVIKIKTIEDMTTILSSKGRSLDTFKAGMTIEVWNKMKKGYSYTLEKNPGEGFQEDFKPYANPGEMLAAGAFEGKYLNDCLLEFPAEWFWAAIQLDKLRPGKSDVSVNLFSVDSRKSLKYWIDSGWLPGGHKKGQLMKSGNY